MFINKNEKHKYLLEVHTFEIMEKLIIVVMVQNRLFEVYILTNSLIIFLDLLLLLHIGIIFKMLANLDVISNQSNSKIRETSEEWRSVLIIIDYSGFLVDNVSV